MESKYAGLSPFNYCANNPIIFLDDDGRDIIHFIKTVTVVNVSKSGMDNFPSKPIIQSSFKIEITPSKGPDIFKYSKVGVTYDKDNVTTKTNTQILHPENPSSAAGMTKGKNLYFDGLITTDRNNKDWESVGKVMAADKQFSQYMRARNPEAKKWESMAFGLDTMERTMPDLVRGAFASYLGMRFLGGAKTISNAKSMEPLAGQMSPLEINFSQRTVNSNVEAYTLDMQAGKWDWTKSGPIRIMEQDGKWVTYDNRRLMAAQNANLENIPYKIVKPNEIMPGKNITWEEAFTKRFNDKRNVEAGGVVPQGGLSTQPKILN